tara:strand:- start:195 stop:3548 length:3354 start_codon:yes stop_codon:yes gene_type:complete
MNNILSTFFLTLIFYSQIQAQKLAEFDYEITSKNVNTTIVDSYGLYWIATKEGLNMFDGNNVHTFFSVLSNKRSILNNSISSIIELENKDLVFISKDGLSIFNRKSFDFTRKKISYPVSILHDEVNKLYYVTTSQNGIFQLDRNFDILDHFKTDPLNPFTISSNAFSFENRQKTIKLLNQKGDFLVAADQVLNLFNSKTHNFKRFQFSDQKTKEKINSIYNLNNNHVMIGRNHGLEILDIEKNSIREINRFQTTKIYDLVIIDQSQYVEGLEENIQGNENLSFYVFVLTDESLHRLTLDKELKITSYINLYDNSEVQMNKISLTENSLFIWSNYESNVIQFNFFGKKIDQFSNEYSVNNICVDSDENLILSTINGLFFDKPQTSVFSVKNVLGKNRLKENSQINFYKRIDTNRSIIVDRYNVTLIDNKKNLSIPLNSFMSDESLFQLNNSPKFGEKIVFYGENNLAILSSLDLHFLDLNNFSVKSYSLPENIFFTKLDFVNPNLYLSYQEGIYTFNLNKKSFKGYNHDELFNKNFPRGFSDIEKVENNLWVANLETGLHVFKNNLNSDVKLFSTDTINPKKLTSFSVNKINYDRKLNKVLVSTMGDGLFVYTQNDSIFKQISTDHGLLSNNIFDAEFGKEYLWILTGKGINYFGESNNKSFKYEIKKSDGLDLLLFNDDPIRLYLDDPNTEEGDDEFMDFNEDQSEILVEIIGNDKILSLDTSDILFDDKPYQVSILNTKIFSDSREFKLALIENNNIEMGSLDKFIEIELFTNNKVKRDQVEYFYSLNSNENEFSSIGQNNILRLQSLPNYNSEVIIKAVNKSGIESENIVRLNIFKLPPWYQRTESIIAYIILSILGIYFYSRWREKSASKKSEEERRNKELEEARKLQNSLLPKSIPIRKDYDISVYLKSATEVGGDYYDFIENDNNELFVVCGDATGHGVVSGIMVSVTKAGLNGIEMADPSSILDNLNSIVKRVNFGRLRMSLSVAKMNNGSVELSSAAMPPTYYYNSKKDLVEEILVPNLPLGGIEGERFEGVKKDFKKGDVMVMISDGLPELPNPENILLDYQKVLECIESNCDGSADKIKDALVDMSETWADGKMNPDDITIVVIKKAS